MKYEHEYLQYVRNCVEINRDNIPYRKWVMMKNPKADPNKMLSDSSAGVRLLRTLEQHFNKSKFDISFKEISQLSKKELFSIPEFGNKTYEELIEILHYEKLS